MLGWLALSAALFIYVPGCSSGSAVEGTAEAEASQQQLNDEVGDAVMSPEDEAQEE